MALQDSALQDSASEDSASLHCGRLRAQPQLVSRKNIANQSRRPNSSVRF